ncbi:hypothetical protein SESBI_42769 [Sesbania bispinosa]|nr:hypothetical protein SESBI_42769 [Sesbania bispinosa]
MSASLNFAINVAALAMMRIHANSHLSLLPRFQAIMRELGPWLRASFMGRKVLMSQSQPHREPRESAAQKPNDNMSPDFIALMAALNMSHDPPCSQHQEASPTRAPMDQATGNVQADKEGQVEPMQVRIHVPLQTPKDKLESPQTLPLIASLMCPTPPHSQQ